MPFLAGFDTDGGISNSDGQAMWNLGARVIGFYVASHWGDNASLTPGDTQRLAQIGYWFLPIYRGRSTAYNPGQAPATTDGGDADAAECVSQLKAFGYAPGRYIPIVLDVEENYADYWGRTTANYVVRWINNIRNAGYMPGVYCSASGMHDFMDLVQGDSFGYWASWLYGNGSSYWAPGENPYAAPGMSDSHWQSMRGAWQYAGGQLISGVNIAMDFDVFDCPICTAAGPSALGHDTYQVAPSMPPVGSTAPPTGPPPSGPPQPGAPPPSQPPPSQPPPSQPPPPAGGGQPPPPSGPQPQPGGGQYVTPSPPPPAPSVSGQAPISTPGGIDNVYAAWDVFSTHVNVDLPNAASLFFTLAQQVSGNPGSQGNRS